MSSEITKLLIDGKWVEGSTSRTMAIINPATEEVVGELACAEEDDLLRALKSADKSFFAWKNLSAAERSVVVSRAATFLEERKLTIAKLLTAENGKSLTEAAGELQFSADCTKWYAEEAKRAYGRVIPGHSSAIKQLTVREPVGPAAGFAAWNFPAGNVTLKIAAALSAGCPIIIKPSDETPRTAAAIAQCFIDAGAPSGVLNVIYGPPAAISEYLLNSPIIKKVSLTGSTPVGKHLQKLAADTLKRCTMELGGHAPVIVFPDAEMERAVDRLVTAKFRNAGQVCTSPSRFYVHKDCYDDFVKTFADKAAQVRVGNGDTSDAIMGPMITKKRQTTMQELVDDAVSHGGKVVCGGSSIPGPGYFFEPTVLVDVPPNARIMNEEPFGPIAAFSSFATTDEAIREANRLPFGLAAYVFTESGRLAAQVSAALEAGVVGVNHTAVHEPETPFGGVNESGYGAESGIEGLDAYLRTKLVTETYE